MEFTDLFLQRHQVLYEFYLDYLWKVVPSELMRVRPQPKVNSLAWNLWHISRVEDAGLNRFVADRHQILDEGNWMARLHLPWRDVGTGMNLAEVDELDRQIDLDALHDYSKAVQARTIEIVSQLQMADLDPVVPVEKIRAVVIDEGFAHSDPEGLVTNYTGWTKGRFFMVDGLTHPFQHLGEMEVITTLLGVSYD